MEELEDEKSYGEIAQDLLRKERMKDPIAHFKQVQESIRTVKSLQCDSLIIKGAIIKGPGPQRLKTLTQLGFTDEEIRRIHRETGEKIRQAFIDEATKILAELRRVAKKQHKEMAGEFEEGLE